MKVSRFFIGLLSLLASTTCWAESEDYGTIGLGPVLSKSTFTFNGETQSALAYGWEFHVDQRIGSHAEFVFSVSSLKFPVFDQYPTVIGAEMGFMYRNLLFGLGLGFSYRNGNVLISSPTNEIRSPIGHTMSADVEYVLVDSSRWLMKAQGGYSTTLIGAIDSGDLEVGTSKTAAVVVEKRISDFSIQLKEFYKDMSQPSTGPTLTRTDLGTQLSIQWNIP